MGACFTEARIIRIEDAYLEERFNKEIDKKTNYRTKSILCCPLINNEGDCFGVIEAINNPEAKLAYAQLPKLAGLEVHSSVILSQVDVGVFKKLGVNLTCEPKYQSKKLFHT